MMGPSMIRSMQNAAVFRHYSEQDYEVAYEVAEEVALERGWLCDEQGVWTDEEGWESNDSPDALFLEFALPEEMENAILDQLQDRFGPAHPTKISADDAADSLRHITFIPSHRISDKFTEVETFFVDSSGFGSDYEPALTFPRFVERATALILSREPNPTYFAISESGQFQVHIAAYGRKADG